MYHPSKVVHRSNSSDNSDSSDDKSIENIVENYKKIDRRIFLKQKDPLSNSEPSIHTPSEASNHYKDTRNITSSNDVLSPKDDLKRRLYEAEKIANDQAEQERRNIQDDFDAKEKKAKRKARKRTISDANVIEVPGSKKNDLELERSPSQSNIGQEDETNTHITSKSEKSRKSKHNKVAINFQEYPNNQTSYIESSGNKKYTDSPDLGNDTDNQTNQDSFVSKRHGENGVQSIRPDSSGNRKYGDPVSPVGHHEYKERKQAKISEQYSNMPIKNGESSNQKGAYEGNLPPLAPKGSKTPKSPRKEQIIDHEDQKQYSSSSEDLRKIFSSDESTKKPMLSTEQRAIIANNLSAPIYSLVLAKPPTDPYLVTSPIIKQQQFDNSTKQAIPEIQSSMQAPMSIVPPAVSKEDEQMRLAVLHSSGLLDGLQGRL
jgi:hypothetical protein